MDQIGIAKRQICPFAKKSGVSTSDASEMLNVSARSVASARKIRDHGTGELTGAVESVAVSVAASVSGHPRTAHRVRQPQRRAGFGRFTCCMQGGKKPAGKMLRFAKGRESNPGRGRLLILLIGAMD